MRRFVLFVALVCASFSFAQVGMNYKALIKDANNAVLANTSITIQFSILQGQLPTQTTVYVETHSVTTDANGIIIVNIGEGTPTLGVFNDIVWEADFGFLNTQIDSGSGFVDLGTTAFKGVPFAYLAETALNVTGLEAIFAPEPPGFPSEGTGLVKVNRTASNYGNVGYEAVDLSFSNTADTTLGATGDGALASGFETKASGDTSTAMGSQTTASGLFSTAIGVASVSESYGQTSLGLYNVPTTANSTLTFDPLDRLLVVGNGTDSGNTSDALVILKNGTITAPSLDTSEITNAKALVTKEYADANYNNVGFSGDYNDLINTPNLFSGNYGDLSGLPTLFSGSYNDLSDLPTLFSGDYNDLLNLPTIISPTGLEAIDEGNGDGLVKTGRDSANYGNIGLGAVDLSDSGSPSSTRGATGPFSAALGSETIASGDGSTAMGMHTTASGNFSTAMGYGTLAQSFGSTAIGYYNLGGGNPTSIVSTDPIFEIGNGLTNSFRSNVLTVLKNGTVTAPSFNISEITDDRALITKEYAEANFSNSGLETIDEGNGTGFVIVGRDSANYGNIGLGAVDLSDSGSPSSTKGATGPFSAALGQGTVASGDGSTAMGAGTEATGDYSTAMGIDTKASGHYSTAMGTETTASDQYSTAMGRFSIASGRYSTAMGFGTEASGENSTALGSLTEASGENSTAMGSSTVASGFTSTTMGFRTKAEAYSSTSIGYYNVGGGNPTSIVSTDPIFEIGIGTDDFNRNNALTVLKNGNVGINTNSPDVPLQLDGGSNASLSAASGYLQLGQEASSNLVIDDNEILARNNGSVNRLYLNDPGGPISFGTNKTTYNFEFEAASDNYIARFENTTGGGSDGIIIQTGPNGNPDNSNNFIRFRDGDGTDLGSIRGGTTNQIAFLQNSDARLKEDVEAVSAALTVVRKMEPVTYKFIAGNGQRSTGFLAQDLQKVYPGVVSGNPDDDVNVDPMGIDYGMLTPILTAAIQEIDALNIELGDEVNALKTTTQEQQAIIDKLNERIKALEAQNKTLLSLEARLKALENNANTIDVATASSN